MVGDFSSDQKRGHSRRQCDKCDKSHDVPHADGHVAVAVAPRLVLVDTPAARRGHKQVRRIVHQIVDVLGGGVGVVRVHGHHPHHGHRVPAVGDVFNVELVYPKQHGGVGRDQLDALDEFDKVRPVERRLRRRKRGRPPVVVRAVVGLVAVEKRLRTRARRGRRTRT